MHILQTKAHTNKHGSTHIFMHPIQQEVSNLTCLLHPSAIVPLNAGSSTSIAHSSAEKSPSQINTVWKSIICNMLPPKHTSPDMPTQQRNADTNIPASALEIIDFSWFSKRLMYWCSVQYITDLTVWWMLQHLYIHKTVHTKTQAPYANTNALI